MKHGKGRWAKQRDTYSNTYDGEYYMDKKQGYGEFKWASGNFYKGNYKNDLRNGFGEMCWTDGSIYKGNWVNGIQHGYGKMYFIDGTVNEGIFDHNVFQGPVNGQHSEIAEESYDDGTQEGVYDYEDKTSMNEDLAENYQKKIKPIMTKHKRIKSSKKRPKSKKNFDNTDEEIDDILDKVKAIQNIENEQSMLRKEDIDNRRRSRERERQNSNLKQKSGSRSKSKSKLKLHKRSSQYDSRASSQAKELENERITIEGSIDMTSEENEVYNYYNATPILPHVNRKRTSAKKGKKTIQPRPIRKNHSKQAVEPERKMYIISSSSKHHDQSSRDKSLSKRRLSNERMFSKKLFSDREKTIGGTNTLANHGLQNRRSRGGKMSKTGLKLQNMSDDDSKNNTTTVFPTIENSHLFHPNFGKFFHTQIFV